MFAATQHRDPRGVARAEFDAQPTEGAGALEERARAVRAYPKRSRPLSIAASTLCRIKLSASTPWPSMGSVSGCSVYCVIDGSHQLPATPASGPSP